MSVNFSLVSAPSHSTTSNPSVYSAEKFEKLLRKGHKFSTPVIVEGNVTIFDCDHLILPGELTVKGDLFITRCENVSLPESLEVEGCVQLMLSITIQSLPKNLKIKGWLNLCQCTLTSFPETKPEIGSHIHFGYSLRKTSAPHWIADLGPCSDGSTRKVTIQGIDKEVQRELSQMNAPGIEFIFRI